MSFDVFILMLVSWPPEGFGASLVDTEKLPALPLGNEQVEPAASDNRKIISLPEEAIIPLNAQLENPETGDAIAASFDAVENIFEAFLSGYSVSARRVISSPATSWPRGDVVKPNNIVGGTIPPPRTLGTANSELTLVPTI
jgi:hypothetical protein